MEDNEMIGTFSPTDSALLLIDHQLGTMKLIKNIPLDVVKRNTLALAKTAKLLGIPVILTSSQEQNQQGPLMPELEQILPEMVFDSFKRQSPTIQASDKNRSRDIARKTRRRSRSRNTKQYSQAGSPEKGVRNAISDCH